MGVLAAAYFPAMGDDGPTFYDKSFGFVYRGDGKFQVFLDGVPMPVGTPVRIEAHHHVLLKMVKTSAGLPDSDVLTADSS